MTRNRARLDEVEPTFNEAGDAFSAEVMKVKIGDISSGSEPLELRDEQRSR